MPTAAAWDDHPVDIIEWVVFDLGNVVLTETTAMDGLAEHLGVSPERLLAAYYEHRLDYDRHSDATVYWTRVAEAAGAPGPDAVAVASLVEMDDTGWSVTDPETLVLVDELKAAGVRLAVLSNAPSSMGRLVEAAPWSAVFEDLMFSGDHGVVKPHPEVFGVLLGRLGAAAGRTVLVDDRADNVAGARAAGMAAIEFRSTAQAREELRALGLPV